MRITESLCGATRLQRGKVLRLLPGQNGITGVDYECKKEQKTLLCEQCVVAAGAWSYELLKGINVNLPIIRKKCIILELNSKIVDKITVCLDMKKEDGTVSDASLVPFGDKTLAAGTDFKVVYLGDEQTLEGLKAGAAEIKALIAELRQFFPKARYWKEGRDFKVRTCFKTEQYNPGHPDVGLKVYTKDPTAGGYGHGVPGLIVALPGKASLMFDLAREVAKLIL